MSPVLDSCPMFPDGRSTDLPVNARDVSYVLKEPALPDIAGPPPRVEISDVLLCRSPRGSSIAD